LDHQALTDKESGCCNLILLLCFNSLSNTHEKKMPAYWVTGCLGLNPTFVDTAPRLCHLIILLPHFPDATK